MAAVGIVEHYDRSVENVFAALGLQPPETYSVKQRLVDLMAQNPSFVHIGEVEPTEADRGLVADLTCFDNELYQQAQKRLEQSRIA
jgi:hypothetical protein